MVSAAVVVPSTLFEGVIMKVWLQRVVVWISACIFISSLAGCSLWRTESEEVRQRDAVQRLGVDAINQLFVPAERMLLSRDDMVLVARPAIEPVAAKLPIDAQVDGPRLRLSLIHI